MSIDRMASGKNVLEELKSGISVSETEIQKEFETTGNSWPNCFGSMLSVVKMYLGLPSVQGLLTVNQLAIALERSGKLTEELLKLRKKYPGKKKSPSKRSRQRLIKKLDVFAEDWDKF